MLGDGTYGSRNLPCNIGINRTKQDRLNRINYTMKEDPNPLQKLNGPLGTAMSKVEVYHALNDRQQVRCVAEGMQLVKANAPEEYYKFGDAIQRRLEKDLGGPVEKEYTLAKFRGIRAGESAKLDLSKPVVLYGKSGKAKTDFAMAQGKCPLLIDEPDKIKEITPMTDLLVFDDMNFGPEGLNFTAEKAIHLLDMKKSRRSVTDTDLFISAYPQLGSCLDDHESRDCGGGTTSCSRGGRDLTRHLEGHLRRRSF